MTLAVQEIAKIEAVATDEFGNVVPGTLSWSVTADEGSIDSGGRFVAGTVAGEYTETIEALFQSDFGDVAGTASVIVKPGPLDSILIAPSEVALDVRSSHPLTFQAFDEFGNQITDAVPVWRVPSEVGTIDQGTFTSGTQAGVFPGAIELDIVNGTDRATDAVDVTVLPGPLADITVEPAYVLVEKGDSQQFSAVGTDEFGNVLADLAIAWETTGSSIDQAGEFSAGTQSGRYEVSAAAFSGHEATGTATVDVPQVEWDFTESTFGWLAAGIDIRNLGITSEGLDLDSVGFDPILTIPGGFDVGAADLIIRIRMRSTAPGPGAFWILEPGPSVSFDVVNDGQWHDYEIQLPQKESGTGFRFDPASGPGHITIASIQVVRNPSALSPTEAAPTFLRKWGSLGSGDGQFNSPLRVATDSSGNVYVASHASNRVQKFTPEGVFLAGWGSEGSGDGEFFQPRGLAVDSNGQVYVADFQNHRIQKFDGDSRFVVAWGSFGGNEGQFNGPHGVAIDPQGDVYVTDRWNHRIQKFTSDGLFITQWGGFGGGEGRFNSPTGIAVDASGNVYVAEVGDNNAEGGHRIQKFNSGGAFIAEWGSLGSERGRFNAPADVTVDSLGNVYVVDSRNNRIQKFTEDGVFLTAWGSEGNDNGQFFRPFGLTVDPSDRMIVADNQNFRVQVFEP